MSRGRRVLWLAPLVLLTQCRSRARAAPAPAASGATSKSKPPAPVAQRTAPSATASPLLRVVPLLDPDKGRRAVAAYPRAAANAKALASGSFTAAGEDEVLLGVSSGRDRAAGDHALALMRLLKGHYQLVGNWLIANDTFTARLRLATRDGKDVLIVCHQGGQQGLYQGSCGFFGRGGFAKGANGPDASATDIPTGFVTACGPARSVSLDSVSLRGDTVRFKVKLEHSVRSPGKGEHAGGGYCSRVRVTSRRSYAIDYRYDGAVFKRGRPIPTAIMKALANNER